MAISKVELLSKLESERAELADKIKALQAFILKIQPKVKRSGIPVYAMTCQKQLASMQDYHEHLCTRIEMIASNEPLFDDYKLVTTDGLCGVVNDILAN